MTQKTLQWFFVVQCQLLLLIVYSSEGFEGGADAIQHWLISRDAPFEVSLFLNQWNKPIFTLLSAPFAQFGLIGMRLFSAATGILTGIVLHKTVKERFGNLSWLPAIMLFMTPKYLELLTSSMTEPLFALFLSLFVLLIQQKNFGWMAIIAGLSPFVRQEGMALVLVGLMVLILVKKWRYIPMLLFGTLVMAIIGWAASGDIGWILTSFPYNSAAAEIYGSGDLFHYLNNYRTLFGTPLSVVFLLGILVLLFSLRKKEVSSFKLALLAGLVFSVMFFSAHSYVWWKGLSGSLGLIRVMACISPVLALVASYAVFKALNLIPSKNNPVILTVLLFPLIGAMSYEAFTMTDLPTPYEQSDVVMQRTVNWLKQQKDIGEIYYSNPVFSYYATEAQLEHGSYGQKSINPSQLNELNVGDVVVWDAHFSANEGRLPLEKLLQDPFYYRVKSFKPDDAFIVLGDHPYVVHVFQKTEKRIIKQSQKHLLVFEDFESKSEQYLIDNKGRNASKCAVANADREFVTIKKDLTKSNADTLVSFQVEAWIKPIDAVGEWQLFLVSDIGELHYLRVDVPEISGSEIGKWHQIKQSFEMPAELTDSFTLKCYIWNPERLEVYVDDFRLEAVAFNQYLQ